jgi:hypothetical protein
MAKHTVTVHPSKPLDVASADLVIEVTSSNKKLGELWISRGSIDWKPRSKQYATTSLTWEKFADVMQKAGE